MYSPGVMRIPPIERGMPICPSFRLTVFIGWDPIAWTPGQFEKKERIIVNRLELYFANSQNTMYVYICIALTQI